MVSVLCLCSSPYFPRCCFLLAFLKSHPASSWLRIQPKIWEEIVYRVFGLFVINFFLFGPLSFESQTLWQPPGPDFYLLSPVNSSLFLSCPPSSSLPSSPQVLPAFTACLLCLLTVVSYMFFHLFCFFQWEDWPNTSYSVMTRTKNLAFRVFLTDQPS